MKIGKTIAVTGLMAVVGFVLYRFGHIVVEVLREEFAGKPARSKSGD
jgi:hypothetical protein